MTASVELLPDLSGGRAGPGSRALLMAALGPLAWLRGYRARYDRFESTSPLVEVVVGIDGVPGLSRAALDVGEKPAKPLGDDVRG